MRAITSLIVAFAFALSGCATTPPPVSGNGVVLSIQEREQASTTGSIVGAIGGAVVGSFLGSQIGGGTGQAIATTAVGVGGSMAGSAIGAKAGEKTVWSVSVRFEDGIDRAITVSERPDYRPGDKVRVDNGLIRRR
jgi:outer membrane lipoprotein SlyB